MAIVWGSPDPVERLSDPALLADARGWIADCYWPDMDSDAYEMLTPGEIIRGVGRHYAGGVAAFEADGVAS